MSVMEFWWLFETKHAQMTGGLTQDDKASLYALAFGDRD